MMMPKTVHEYFYELFVNGELDDSYNRDVLKSILNADGGAGDDCTVGNILEEMPLDSNCGEDCKACLDRAHEMMKSIRDAFGANKPDHYRNILTIACDVCLCYIRG